MNTQEVVKKVQQIGGGIALLSAAGLAYAIVRRLNNHQTYERPFDPQNMVELMGKVLEFVNSQEKKDEIRGAALILETKDEEVPIHLGPTWYMDHQPHQFKQGDKIQVTGSKTRFKETEIIVATKIQRGNMEMILRDEEGNPVWESWHKVST